MADQFGAITIPVAAPAAGDPAGDPCLGIILSYLQAFLQTDANLTAAWNAVAPNPSTPVVKRIFAHNPADVVFSTSNIPALYMWRESGKMEQIGDDLYQDLATVKGLWVFALASQANQRPRQPIINALVKAILVGIERGRTPSWTYPGDMDPRAATEGSLFYTAANFSALRLDPARSWRKAELQIEMADRSSRESYAAVELTFDLAEIHDEDPNRSPPTSPASGNLTLKNEVGDVTVEGPL